MYFKLQKPTITQSDIQDALALFQKPSKEVRQLLKWSEEPIYRYWDDVRHRAKTVGIKPEVGWMFIDISRNINSKTQRTPVRDTSDTYFKWNSLTKFDSFFHEVDMGLGGSMSMRGIDLDEKYKQDFITRGVMEEAIASSQLEGANTARKVAKKMLLEGRRPGTKSERMIVNNHKGMLLIEEEYKHQELSLDMILKLHEILTTGTLEDESDCGRIRSSKADDVHVEDPEGVIYHLGPEPTFVATELERLVYYANKSSVEAKEFTHPVVKAIVLHFWIGYLHPFVDGNGRLARTLFYWSLLRDGYWGFTYLPISRVIKESSTQYKMAYVYTEQDDADFTYFLDYNVRKIELALRNFKEYAAQKSQEHASLKKNLTNSHGLNDRQIRTLQYLHANKDEFITTRSYQTVNHVSGPTAAKDVKQLVQTGFLKREKRGRRVMYFATNKITSLFKK